MTIVIPTIHMNGTSRESLLDDLIAASEALQIALDKVGRTMPNGRDYYPQGDAAHREALRQHVRRIQDLTAIRREIVEIAEAIA